LCKEFSGIIDANERQLYRRPQNRVISDAPLHEGYTPDNPDPERLTTSVDAFISIPRRIDPCRKGAYGFILPRFYKFPST